MTAGGMLTTVLKSLGADGLVNPGAECGCSIYDLNPCECIHLDKCEAARRVDPPEWAAECGYTDWYVPMDQAGGEGSRHVDESCERR